MHASYMRCALLLAAMGVGCNLILGNEEAVQSADFGGSSGAPGSSGSSGATGSSGTTGSDAGSSGTPGDVDATPPSPGTCWQLPVSEPPALIATSPHAIYWVQSTEDGHAELMKLPFDAQASQVFVTIDNDKITALVADQELDVAYWDLEGPKLRHGLRSSAGPTNPTIIEVTAIAASRGRVVVANKIPAAGRPQELQYVSNTLGNSQTLGSAATRPVAQGSLAHNSKGDTFALAPDGSFHWWVDSTAGLGDAHVGALAATNQTLYVLDAGGHLSSIELDELNNSQDASTWRNVATQVRSVAAIANVAGWVTEQGALKVSDFAAPVLENVTRVLAGGDHLYALTASNQVCKIALPTH